MSVDAIGKALDEFELIDGTGDRAEKKACAMTLLAMVHREPSTQRGRKLARAVGGEGVMPASLQPFTRSVAQSLREAGDEGMTALEIATSIAGEDAALRHGTHHVELNIAILNRNRFVVGYRMDEGEKRYFLAHDAERATDEPGPQVVLADGERSVASPAAGSSVAPSEGRLFELPSTQRGMSDQPIRTWTLSEVTHAALACWPSGTPESAEYARRYRTKTLIELEPVLDLLGELKAEMGRDWMYVSTPLAQSIERLLREHGRPS